MKLEERLQNWGKWARTGIKLKTCGSAEKHYRAPWRQWVELKDISISDTIDAFDAELVEYAWRTIPFKSAKLLKLHYIRRLPVSVIAGRCGIKLWHYDAAFARAHYHIRQSLDNEKNLCDKGVKCDTASERMSEIPA